MSIRVRFAWYDFWVGAFYDRAARVLYICPLPTLLIRISLSSEEEHIPGGHAIGFDGCPACPDCPLCDYDCCSDCAFDQQVEVSKCPTCNQMTREGTISVHYSNQVCECENHVCPPL